MPSIEYRSRFQKAVLWEANGFDSYGRPKVGNPVEISVRWKHSRKESIGSDGTPIAIDATVVVDRVIPVGSCMWLGELADWVGTGSNDDIKDVMQVVSHNVTPDVRNRHTMYTINLSFFKDQLPELS